MPTFGTFIADFSGKLHDVSKGAFDAIALRETGKEMGQLRDEFSTFGSSFKDSFQKYLKKINIEVDFATPGAVENIIKAAIGKITVAYGGKIAASAAAVFGGEEIIAASVAGPLGAIVALAADFAILAFMSSGDETPITGYKPGQWIMIDNGMKTVGKKIERSIGWAETQIFGDAPITSDFELDRQEDYSIGFILGEGREQGHWEVFNFKTGDEETHHKRDVRPVDSAVARDLDTNDEMTLVREFKFLEDDHTFLEGQVPTKPGSQVIYKGTPYRVVSSEAFEVLLENNSGDQIKTNINNLSRGKVTSTASYNMKNGKPVTEGFVTTSTDSVHSGQWIWLAPSIDQKVKFEIAKRVLGIIVLIDGELIRGVYALDGRVFEVVQSKITLATTESTESFRGIKAFTEFQLRATERRVSESELMTIAPGHEYPLICLGVAQEPGRETLTQKKRKVELSNQKFQYIDYVGDYGRVREADIWEEAIEKGEILPGTEGEEGVEGKEDRLLSVQGGGMTPVLIAGLVLAGWYFLG